MRTKIINDNGENPVFLLIGEENADTYLQASAKFAYVTVYDFDWNGCLSPWFAEKVFRKGEDFGGKADQFLEELMPVLRSFRGRNIYICGYSLAGLFALYASEQIDLFTGCASVSGSLWYPNWLDYLADHPVHAGNVYLSLGDREKNAGSPIMSRVEECTLKAAEIVGSYANVCFELNNGGHFGMAEERIKKAVKWLAKSIATE